MLKSALTSRGMLMQMPLRTLMPVPMQILVPMALPGCGESWR